jgi:D-3-phosphoglycerate dehydrogenase / 2-oxoglutarate reductase
MLALRLNSETFPMTLTEGQKFLDGKIELWCAEALDERTHALLPKIDALLVVSAKVSRDTIETLEQCRVIVRYGSGTDNVDVEGATRRGIVVANVPSFCLSEVADHTMALLLAVARKIVRMDRHTRTGEWQARATDQVHRISGKTLGLVGFGAIAQQVARRAASFDLRVVAFDPALDRDRAKTLGIEPMELDRLLRSADFISLHAPLTERTRNMIGESQLKQMKAGCILINTGRGGLVDEDALVLALSQNRIAGAGIDVYGSLPMFEACPEFVHHPLFDLENVVLTPHSAGTSVESLEQLMSEGAEQALAVLAGRAPRNFVNSTVKPRFPFSG